MSDESIPRNLLTGRLLVADLDVQEIAFRKSVILLVNVGSDGALGLILNRPLGLTAAQIVDADEAPPIHPERRGQIPLHSGGPVEPQSVVALHRGLPSPFRSDSAVEVLPGVWFEPSFAAVRPYVAGRTEDFPPDDRPEIRLYLGYAGWAPNQLETELAAGVWQTVPGRANLVFTNDPDVLWLKAMELRGGFWAITAQTGVKPSWN